MTERIRVTRLIAAVLAALILLAVVPAVAPAEGYGDNHCPARGTWRISQKTMVADETIVVTGDIEIVEGAHLLLLDTTLIMNCSYPNQYRVVVRPGASLEMVNSYILPMNETNSFKFQVEPDPSGWTIDPQAAFIIGTFVGIGVGFPLGITSTAYAYKRWFSRNLPPPV